MIELNLPTYKYQIKKDGLGAKIFDPIRKKYTVLTPEEWVRQHVLNYLVEFLGYPSGLINVEKKVDVNGQPLRVDILTNSNSGMPLLLVECKAPDIKLTQNVFDQILVYNQSLKVPYLMITNGLSHYCFRLTVKGKKYEFLSEIPSYDVIKNSHRRGG